MPKFDAALNYEFHYPPTWGAGVVLDPYDFEDFFDDAEAFLQRWEEKKREYETPGKERFYCCACEVFLCARPKDGSSFGVRCFECEAVTCMPCGADITAPIVPHMCPPPPSEDVEMADKFRDLVRGKHYQLCPRACGAAVELKDGCNHIVCPGSNCSAEFCFICGEEATPDSGHWDVGKPCPRWNHPDEANAQHDIPDLEARLLAIRGDGENVVNEAMGMQEDPDEEMGASEALTHLLGPVPEPLDLLLDTIGQGAYDAIVSEVRDALTSLPRPPNRETQSEDAALRFERDNADGLLASPATQLMRQHRADLAHLIAHAVASLREALTATRAGPAWLEAAIRLMTALRRNLRMYVHRAELRADFETYVDAHEMLEAAHGRHQREIFPRYRRFYEILAGYQGVADHIFASEMGGSDADSDSDSDGGAEGAQQADADVQARVRRMFDDHGGDVYTVIARRARREAGQVALGGWPEAGRAFEMRRDGWPRWRRSE